MNKAAAGPRTREGEPVLDVMVVEDDLHFLRRLGEMVQSTDSLRIVATVTTVSEALRCFDTITPDLLLVDLGLPDGSGLEVIRAAAARPVKCEILVVTVFGDLDNMLASIEAGATGYFVKDDPNDDCLQRIADLRAGGSPVSPMIARQLLKRLQHPQVSVEAASATATSTLSKREFEVLSLLSRGFHYREIGAMLETSENTIRSQIKSIYHKLQVNSRSEAVFEAHARGILPH